VPTGVTGPRAAFRDLRTFARYARRLPLFLGTITTPEEARRRVSHQLRNRESSFLDVLQRGVYDSPRSPYRKLLDAAGAEMGDVRELVARHGLEGSLASLHAAGVRLSLDEFKGRRPIERAGLSIDPEPGQFSNPLISVHLPGSTSGSTGAPRRIAVDLDILEYETAYRCMFLDSFKLWGRPYALWRVVPPSASGIGNAYRQVKVGEPVARWFNPYRRRRDLEDLQFALFTTFSVRAGRLLGAGLRPPEYCPPGDAGRIARWLAECRVEGRPAVLDTQAALGVRVCLAAIEEGLDISGTFMRFGGEPFTAAKAEIVARAGVRAVCHYTMGEAGRVGVACADAAVPDDVHFLSDKLAVVPQEVPGGDGLSALSYTSFLPSAPKLLLNVESGDCAELEERDCDCAFGQLGMRLHLHGIHSFEKLTSEGNHFLGSDLIALVEKVLPARFGGAPTDYQVVEEEVAGLPKVSIVVRQQVGPVADADVVATVISFLSSVPRNRLMAGVWAQSDTLRVVRRDPHATRTGKIPSLRINRGG
jgi:hypothetical protein